MKKYLLVFVFLYFSLSYSQSRFEPGVYVSQNEEKGIELKINEDGTYEFIILSGKIENKKDTLVLKNKYSGLSPFQVTAVKDKVNPDKLNFIFKYKYFEYYSSKIFIGTQENENDEIVYKGIKEYLSDKEQYQHNESEKEITFTIDRAKYVYLVIKEKLKISSSKYLLNDDISALDVIYSANNMASLQLKAYAKDKYSIIVTEGKQPLLFTMVNQDVVVPDTTLKPIEVDNDVKIVLPEEYDYNEEDVAFEHSNSEREYAFKHKIDITFKEALETLKKTPNKFLVVAQNSTKEDFDLFVQQDEVALTNAMYYEYDAEYDKYNYYLTTNKDKKHIPSTSKEKQILVLNAEGETLYYAKGSLEENKELFESYSSFNEALIKANIYATLDRLFANKKSTVQEIKTIFSNIIKLETPYDYATVEEVAKELPPPPPPSIEEIENATDVEYAVESVEAVAEVISEDYYDVKDKQNLYQLKITKEVVVDKWQKVLDYYLKQNEFDIEVVKILKKELIDEGFSMKLFNDKKETFSALDYKGLDYLLKFYNQIKIADTAENDYEEDYYSYDQSIDETISSFLNKKASFYYDFSKEDKLKALEYYKKYLEVSNNNSKIATNYISLLGANLSILESKNNYYDAYENYFNSTILLENKSLIEALDEAYEKSESTNWSDFKYTFSNLANDVSWSVVANEKDIQLIKKAIKWSEISLKLNKENAYYLDTLAQLYYKDDQKDKAIATQKQALLAMKGEEESGTYIEMKSVLEKMQNGTY